MRGFGELEAVVMDRVWSGADVITVREVLESVQKTREIAYTTVMSTMDILHRKGWLDRKREGKAYLYWPTLSREEYNARLMREVLESGGDPDLVLTRFVEQLSDDDSARLRGVLQQWAAGEEPA